MASLGDLIINIKVTGDREALAAIDRINQSANRSSSTFRSAAASSSMYFNSMNTGAYNAARAFVNFGDGVNVGNDNLSNLIQNLGALTVLFGKMKTFSFADIFKSNSIKETRKSFNELFKEFIKFDSNLIGGKAFQEKLIEIGKFYGLIREMQLSSLGKKATFIDTKNIEETMRTFKNFLNGYQAFLRGAPDSEGKRIRDVLTDPADRRKARENFKKFKEEYGNVFNSLDNIFGKTALKFMGLQQKFENFMQGANKQKFSRLAANFNFLKDTLGKLIEQTVKYYQVTWAFAVPAFAALSLGSIKAAADIQKMNLQMRAVLLGQGVDPMQVAGQSSKMMTAIKELSKPSVFTAQQIFESSSRMEAFGLNSIKVLNTALKLAEVFGGMPDDLEMVTRMFGRMAAGDLPDIEVLSRFGISKADLNRAGGGTLINMSTGKLAGTAEQGVLALMKLIEERYSGLFAIQKNSFYPAMASLQETFTTVLEELGKPILEVLTPIIQNMTDFADRLISSGAAEHIGKVISSFLEVFQDKEVMKAMEHLVLNITAAVIELNREFLKFTLVLLGLAESVGGVGKMLTGEFKAGWDDFKRGISLMINPGQGTELGSAVQPWPTQLANNIMRGTEFQNELARGFKDISILDFATKGIGNFMGGASGDAILNEMMQGGVLKRKVEEQNDVLETIAQNTGKAADALELRKANMGGRGGPLAQLGMGINAGAGNNSGVTRAAIPASFALLNPLNQLQKSIQMEVFRTTNAQYIGRY